MPSEIDSIDTRADQVNIWAVISYVVGQWRWYLAGSVIGLGLGGLYFAIAPSKYEATVVIQPARMGSMLKVGAQEPEPAPLMVERLKQPGFWSEALREQCSIAPSDDYQKDMVDKINSNIVKLPISAAQNFTMAKITWKGISPSASGKCLEAVVAQLTQVQNQVNAPAIAMLEEHKARSQNLYNVYVEELQGLRAKIPPTGGSANFNQIVIADNIVQNLRSGAANLKNEVAEITAQLAPPYTQPVTMLEPIYVAQSPTITLSLALIIGALIGILGGVVALLVDRSIRLYKAQA